MAIAKIELEELLKLADKLPILDVRSPAEFAHAHIPNAISFPIFSNEERKLIGTAYKQQSREIAIKIGLDIFGKNLLKHVEAAEKISSDFNSSKEMIVHCWRGGMRSAAMTWLLDLYGFKVNLLIGGYKSYRSWTLKQFEKDYQLFIVGGYTGGNKTGIIQELKKQKEAAIDLEDLAKHKGSAFGNLEGIPQPSQEQFENNLALELHQQNRMYPNKHIWLEGESQRIGNINIPASFYTSMKKAPYFFMDIPFEERLLHILEIYGKYKKENLIDATERIRKKLGGLEASHAIEAIQQDDLKSAFKILLLYYDRLYLRGVAKTNSHQNRVITMPSPGTNQHLNAEKLLEHVRNRFK